MRMRDAMGRGRGPPRERARPEQHTVLQALRADAREDSAAEKWIENNKPEGAVVTLLCDRGERYMSIL